MNFRHPHKTEPNFTKCKGNPALESNAFNPNSYQHNSTYIFIGSWTTNSCFSSVMDYNSGDQGSKSPHSDGNSLR